MDTDKEFNENLLAEYRKTVCSVLERKDQGIVHNERPEHASIILEEMANHAEESFYAFARKLASDVWNSSVLKAVSDAKNRGVDIRLIVSDCCEPPEGRIPENLRPFVWRFNKELGEIDDIHYAEMDSRAFRFEEDTDKRKAIFCANAPDMAQRIKILVSKLTRLSTPCYS